MYAPLIASLGVLKPRPTSLYHLFSFVATFFPARIVSMLLSFTELLLHTSYFGVLEKMLFLECLLYLRMITRLAIDTIPNIYTYLFSHGELVIGLSVVEWRGSFSHRSRQLPLILQAELKPYFSWTFCCCSNLNTLRSRLYTSNDFNIIYDKDVLRYQADSHPAWVKYEGRVHTYFPRICMRYRMGTSLTSLSWMYHRTRSAFQLQFHTGTHWYA